MAGRNLLSAETQQAGGRNLLAAEPVPVAAAPTPAPEIDPQALIRSPTQQRRAALEQIARETGPAEAAVVAAGRGLTTIGRAVGLAEPEEPVVTEAFERLQEAQPVATTVGEIVGEAAPFLVPGVAVGAIPGTVARIAATTVLGVTEGGTIAKGRGAGFQETIESAGVGGIVAGGLEAALPVIGRLGGALVRRVTGQAPRGALLDNAGRPTPELQQALDASGQTFDDLAQQGQDFIARQAPGADPEDVARLARFEALGAPATAGDVSQEFAQQATEARLVESAADPLGDPLRNLRLEQSQAFEQQLTQQVDRIGVPEEVGTSLKDALSGRKKLLRAEKNSLYTQAAKAADEIGGVPIITDTISEAIPDAKQLRRLSRIQGNQIGALDDLLVEFGVKKDPGAVERFVEAGGEIEPLSLQNFEEFRQAINSIERADTTGSTSVAIGPIKAALDEEGDLIFQSIQDAGITDENILGLIKEARGTVRQLKTEFSPQAISGRLVDAKRDGVTPVIEASKAFDEVFGANKPPELLDRTLESLRAAGPKGEKAIGDLQARAIMELIGEATKAKTRKVAGERILGGVAFANKLEKLQGPAGAQRLNKLFENNPEALKAINDVAAALEDITVPAGATPKGSASVILDTLNKAGLMAITGKLPGGVVISDLITRTLENAGNRAALQRSLRAKPKVRELAGFVEKELPGIAAPLGVAGIAFEEEEK